MRKIAIMALLLSGLAPARGLAQQDPHYTQYMYNMNIVNPAYAASRGTLSIGVLGRTQWVGIEGAPETLTAVVNAPLGRNLGLGVSAIADNFGPVDQQHFYGDLSYTVKVSETGRLAFGLKMGASLYRADLQGIDLPQGTVDALFEGNLDQVFPNFGVGTFYHDGRFYVGLSTPNLIRSTHFEERNGNIVQASEEIHYFLTTGYVFDLSDKLKFKPSTLLKAVEGSPLSVDVSANFLINGRFEVGANYRYQDAVSLIFLLGVTPNMRIGAAYDHTLTNLGRYNDGSFEVGVFWDIGSTRGNLKSPRFF